MSFCMVVYFKCKLRKIISAIIALKALPIISKEPTIVQEPNARSMSKLFMGPPWPTMTQNDVH